MIRTPALPGLHAIAAEADGYVTEKSEFTNQWPHRSTDVGSRRGSQIVVAEGWDGDHLYAVVASVGSRSR
jgi:hypothetical protein